MKRIDENQARNLALKIVLNRYRREELFTKDCPVLIRGIAKVANIEPESVRDFFAIYVIPTAMRAAFGWVSTTTHCEGRPTDAETQKRIAMAALIYHMQTNGIRIKSRMRRDIQQHAIDTGIDFEELQSLFTDYLIPEAVKAALKINEWRMDVHEEVSPSVPLETGLSDDEIRESNEVGEGL